MVESETLIIKNKGTANVLMNWTYPLHDHTVAITGDGTVLETKSIDDRRWNTCFKVR